MNADMRSGLSVVAALLFSASAWNAGCLAAAGGGRQLSVLSGDRADVTGEDIADHGSGDIDRA
jgi:hypothetical protein